MLLNRGIKVVLFLGIIVLATLTVYNARMMMKAHYIEFFIPAIVSFVAIYLFVIIVKLKPYTFIAILFIASFGLKAIVVTYLKTEPISDFSLFWEAAQQIAEGRREYLHSGYFNIWAYQTGIIIYYSAIIKLLGANLLAVQYVNCIWITLTNVIIYAFCKRLSNENVARIVALAYLLYPEPYFLCSTLSNQLLGDFLVFAAAYLFINRTSMKNMILVGMLGSLANAVRPSGIILLFTVIFILVFELFSYKRSIYRWKQILIQLCKHITTVCITYLLIGVFLSSIIKFTGLNPSGLKNNFPLYKFVVGLNMETRGGYSNEDAKLTGIQTKKQRDTVALGIIRQRLEVGLSQLYDFMHMKFKMMWVNFDTLVWSFERLREKNISVGRINITYDYFSKCILRYEKAIYTIIIFMAMMSCLICFRKREASIAYITPLVLFLLYFAMQMLIEIQVRYRYFALVTIFILSAKTFEILIPTNKGNTEVLPV